MRRFIHLLALILFRLSKVVNISRKMQVLLLTETLHVLKGKDFDAAILGCTHYPLLQHHIRRAFTENVNIISSAVETVRDVEQILLANGIKTDCGE